MKKLSSTKMAIVGLLTVCAAVFGGGAAAQAAPTAVGGVSAQAASTCWPGGFKDAYHTYVWGCMNTVNTRVYQHAVVGTYVDHLTHSSSWFTCRIDNGGYVGGPHPYRWLKAKGDTDGVWGWVKDTDISSNTNTVSLCN